MNEETEIEIGANPIAEAIGAAEDIADPLDGLVEKCAADPGAAFTPEVLERLGALKKEYRAAFELLRSKLKTAGCRVTALDEAIAEESCEGGRGPSHADVLLRIAENAEFFHTRDGGAFADFDIKGHRETWLVSSKGFRQWLMRGFFEETRGAPNSEALQSVLNVLDSRAQYDAPERTVDIRIAGFEDRLYLDLCDETWRAVEIDATGWRVIDNPPVRFRRKSGMLPLPLPLSGGSVELLRAFLNVQSDADFVLVIAWALACLRNLGPYPVLVLSGEQGSAKSTFSKILRALLDPNTATLRAPPREIRDLFIAANSAHLLAFDNLSKLPGWISDTLCRLSTGGSFAVRQLYTDQDEVLIEATRPVILNGIEDIVTQHDLADRAVFLTLEPIPEERRRSEKEFLATFEVERPRILGALLDSMVSGLKALPNTRLDKMPRMADFALWATACESGLWPAGTFLSAYRDNRARTIDSVIDVDPISFAVRSMMAKRTEWTGTATVLLDVLAEAVPERVAERNAWPNNAQSLAGKLRRSATFLRNIGIEITFAREGAGRTRIIRISKRAASNTEPETAGPIPSASSASSASFASSWSVPRSESVNNFRVPTVGTDTVHAGNRADDGGHHSVASVPAHKLKDNTETATDGADAIPQPESTLGKTGAVA